MHVVVCIKQVPDTTEVKINPETGTLIREGVPSIVNPWDTYAVEEAVRLKERFGGRVTVLSMGPPQAGEALREAAAMGCDDIILLSDRAFTGSDTLATSYALSQAIRRIGGYDLIICGKQAIDGDTGQVGPGIARRLGITQLTNTIRIREIDFAARRICVERLLEQGREVVQCRLPALVTVVKGINEPRYPTFAGMRRAKALPLSVWTAADLPDTRPDLLGLEGSATWVLKVFTPPPRAGTCQIIAAASPSEAADLLAEKLLAEKAAVVGG